MGWDIYAYGNRIDKLGKMVWYQFSTIVLQITILGIGDWHRTRAKRVNIQKKIYLSDRIHLYIIKYIHHTINPKYLKKGREKNFIFPQE